ncbi:MAG: hypothetical protein ACRDQZ_11850 [Mycobacteriales bacterium]
MNDRIEFGYERTTCACRGCQTNCRFMPGFLIPADLERMIPADTDPIAWTEVNLLASPGALVAQGQKLFRIPTLVPAVKADRSCMHLSDEGRCDVHAIAPFGCAFFDCGPERGQLSVKGLTDVLQAQRQEGSLYRKIWEHLNEIGRRQLAPEILRRVMSLALGKESPL